MQKKHKIALLVVLLIPCWVIAARFDVDLVTLHRVAKVLYSDVNRVYEQDPGIGRWFYGPISLVLIKPLGALPYVYVKWFWIVLQTVAFAAFWVQLGKLYPFLKQRSMRWGWLLIFIVSINPIHNNFQSNNIQLMLAALLLWSEVLAEDASPMMQWVGGCVCALVAAIKIFPLFIVAFYVMTRPRGVKFGAISGLALSVLIPFVFFGKEESLILFRGFLRNLSTYHADNSLTKVPDILCLPSMVTRWISGTEMEPSAASQWVVRGVVGVIASGFLLSAWRASTAAMHSTHRSRTHWWALAMALCVFLNPSTRPHYFIFFIPAYCSVLELIYENSARVGSTVAIVLSAVLLAFTAEGVVGKTLNNQLELWSLPTLGMSVLCVVLAYALLRNRNMYVS